MKERVPSKCVYILMSLSEELTYHLPHSLQQVNSSLKLLQNSLKNVYGKNTVQFRLLWIIASSKVESKLQNFSVQGEQIPFTFLHCCSPKRFFLDEGEPVSHFFSVLKWNTTLPLILSGFSFMPSLCHYLFILSCNKSFHKICFGFRIKN